MQYLSSGYASDPKVIQLLIVYMPDGAKAKIRYKIT